MSKTYSAPPRLRHLPTTEQNSLLSDSLRRLLDSAKLLRTKGQPDAADSVATFASRMILTYLSTGLAGRPKLASDIFELQLSLQDKTLDDGTKIFHALPFEVPGAISVKVLCESKKAMNTDILLTPTGPDEAMSVEIEDKARVPLSTRTAGDVVKVAFKPGFAKISQGRVFCGFDRATSKGDGKEEFVLKVLPVFVFRSIPRNSVNDLLVNGHFEAVIQACNWCYAVLAKELESNEDKTPLDGLNPERVPVFPFLRLALDIIHRLEAARPGDAELVLLEEQVRVAGETMLLLSSHSPSARAEDIMKRRRREERVLAQLLGVTDDKMEVRNKKLEIAAAATGKASRMEIQTVEQVLEEVVPSPFTALLFYVTAATKDGTLRPAHAKVLYHVAEMYALLLSEGWQPTFQETQCRPHEFMEALRLKRPQKHVRSLALQEVPMASTRALRGLVVLAVAFGFLAGPSFVSGPRQPSIRVLRRAGEGPAEEVEERHLPLPEATHFVEEEAAGCIEEGCTVEDITRIQHKLETDEGRIREAIEMLQVARDSFSVDSSPGIGLLRMSLSRIHSLNNKLQGLISSQGEQIAKDGIIDELEGQVEMLAQQLRSKDRHPFAVDATRESEDFELQQVKDSLEAVQAQRGRHCVRQLGPRTAHELADVESLQSRTGFLSDLVNRFEDKTMALEKELKEMREDRAVDAARQKIVEDAAHQNAEALQQSKEEVESMKLLLRDTKKEHNKRVQDLLKQIQLARGRRTDTKSKEEQERLEQLRDELRELKDLNGRLVERLGHERAEHAEARQQLFRSERERGILEQRTENLSEQLIVLAEVNDSLEHLHEQANAKCSSCKVAQILVPGNFAGWQGTLIHVALQALRLSLYRIGMCLAVQPSHKNSSSQCFAYDSGDGTAIPRVVRPVAVTGGPFTWLRSNR
ncbi:RYR1 [Symbiodinium necroappetens]|uniref:RYR1 protein n=1 Tax=Symbiodinium necroappetens TaxID=1628268 RepID=A0A812L7M1_9DINO|nr:RYR1 [Symbiodinium necroappetens]